MGSDAFARRGRRLGDLRVVVRRPAKLPRTLGPGALFAACYGNVGSSIYYALGVTAAFALGLTPLALILAGFIFVTTALNYAEGTAALPHAGGSSSFARRAFNAPIGYIVGWVQLLNYTATVSISSYFAISYLGFFEKYSPIFWLLKHDNGWHIGATVALIGLLIVVNVIGINESSILNLVLAFTDLVTQLVLVILGLILLLNINRILEGIHLGVAPTWGNLLAGVSIAMVTYTGIGTISNLSEEAKDPGRNVPLATWWVIIAVLFVSAFLPTIGLSVFPVEHVGSKEIDLMSAVYSLAATFAFCSAHLSVMRLRFIEPALHRPYRMPWNVRFGRDSIPVLSLVGALFIGTVFTQLMFQNISNSTFIFMGWLALGVIAYVLYMRYRHEPLWEPLEVPPPREREIERVPYETLPRSARYRMGRRERIAAHAASQVQVHERHRPGWPPELELFFARHGAIRGLLIMIVFAAISGLAVFVELSTYELLE